MRENIKKFLSGNDKIRKNSKPTLNELSEVSEKFGFDDEKVASFYDVKPATIRTWRYRIKKEIEADRKRTELLKLNTLYNKVKNYLILELPHHEGKFFFKHSLPDILTEVLFRKRNRRT